ncbi:hypothetical protein MIMGU_mgv11b021871mg [Erythranthe guttata]|uniref:Reverse transcriptase zinc-binding domain-containing protein n=1 Tax=Erythranthe guttata TaxID=4155 RepID=A0A022QFT4_ERYGU|nr:hypothetical protein MIMGU_mgv11b021871mg [Erythranthe guttata]
MVGSNLRKNSTWQPVVNKVKRRLANWNVKGLYLGGGNHTKFWKDPWFGRENLKTKFERLYDVVLDKERSIANKIVWERGEWRWSWVGQVNDSELFEKS